jgi:2-desacetyl-2-hydroxyethyl bacteriochlorophyllide A dehydrogenase
MEAALFTAVHKMERRDLPQTSPVAGEVLVRVTGCGVCGTDVHILHGDITDGIAPPVVLGHEIAGIVEQAGPEVSGLKPGQVVAIDPVVTCGKCEYCQSGMVNLCRDLQIIGYKRNGGFAQYCVAPASHVVPLREGTSPQAGILVETLACVINGFDRLTPLPGHSALVIGAGTVGLLWTQMLAGATLAPLAVSEPVGSRRELARKLGAEMLFDPSAGGLAEQVRKAGIDGFDYIVDASGDPKAVEEAIPLVRPAGKFLIFGVCPRDSRITVNPFELYNRQISIIASKMPPKTLPRAARLVEAGRIDVNAIVTQTWPLGRLDEAMDGFAKARDRQVKVMIDPWI